MRSRAVASFGIGPRGDAGTLPATVPDAPGGDEHVDVGICRVV